jgi:heme-degrading monooxygenase HmoA
LRPTNETPAIGQISIWQSEADFKGFTASEAGQALLNSATHRQAEDLAEAGQVLTFRHETGWHA